MLSLIASGIANSRIMCVQVYANCKHDDEASPHRSFFSFASDLDRASRLHIHCQVVKAPSSFELASV